MKDGVFSSLMMIDIEYVGSRKGMEDKVINEEHEVLETGHKTRWWMENEKQRSDILVEGMEVVEWEEVQAGD